MAIPDKYKGKSYAQIAKKLQDTYKDRHDPISLRGLNRDMQDLKAAQDYTKQLKAIEEQTQQMLQGNPQEQSQGQPPQAQAIQPVSGGNPNVNISQPEQTFKRQASSDYNSKFAEGGEMGIDPTTMDYSGLVGSENIQGINNFNVNEGIQTPDINVQGIDLSGNLAQQEELQGQINQENNSGNWWEDSGNQMRLGLGLSTAAPIIGNIAQLIGTKPADEVSPRLMDQSSTLAGLRGFKPRESRFDYIDLDNIERGITEASGRFTQNNISASRGNAGAFVANELANQSNLYRAIGDARMKGQQQDLQVDQMNAAEKARVDAMNLQKESQLAQMQGRGDMFNAQMQFQADQANTQNEAAYESTKSQAWSDLFTNLGTAGATLYKAGAIGKGTGYSPITGEYLNSKAEGGMLNTDPTKKYFEQVTENEEGKLVFPEMEDAPKFKNAEEYDKYYTDMIYGYLSSERGVSPVMTEEGDIDKSTTVAMNALFPQYQASNKNKNSYMYSGYGGDSNNTYKVLDAKKLKKARRKAGRQNK